MLPAPAPASPDKQVLHSSLIGSPATLTLDPAHASDPQSQRVVGMLMTGLLSLDNQPNIRPQLASSYDLSADGLTLSFHLRPALKFQDGDALTARDIAFSIDRALQPSTHSTTCMTYLGLIQDAQKLHNGQLPTLIGDSIFTPDPVTLVLKLRQPAAYFLTALAYPCAYVLEEHLVQHYGNEGLIQLLEAGGTAGPFTLSSYTTKELDLTINKNYYGPEPQLRRVVFTFYKDMEASYQDYRAGRIDLTPFPSNLLNTPDTGDWHRTPQLTVYYYAMNYLVKPFDNIHIRQAFELALNKDLLVQAVWHNAFIPTCNIVPQGMTGRNPALVCHSVQPNTMDFNPAQAKELLAEGLQEEGWPSLSALPPVTLTYANDRPSFNNEVMAVRQMWQTVLGIDVKAQAVSNSTLQREIAATAGNPHGLQFWATSWSADYPDPHDLFSLQFGKHSPLNYGQNNASDVAQQQAVQLQLDGADTMLNSTLRQQTYMRAEQQLVNDVAWLPMYQGIATYLLAPYLVNMPYFLPTLIPPDDWANIYIGVR